jgi:hypothetical protein
MPRAGSKPMLARGGRRLLTDGSESDDGDDYCGHGQVDVEGAQREADREVVDA